MRVKHRTPVAVELGLSFRAANPLERAGIETVGELKRRTFTELWRVKGLGVQTLREITDALTARGHALTRDPEENA